MQGAFLQIQNVDKKISNTVHHNWKLKDELLIFCVKARLNILPTNFTLYIWNRDKDPRCQFCNHCTESMTHLLNGCHAESENFYSTRRNRIVNYFFDQLKFIDRRYRNYNNKNIETIMAERRKVLQLWMGNMRNIFICRMFLKILFQSQNASIIFQILRERPKKL